MATFKQMVPTGKKTQNTCDHTDARQASLSSDLSRLVSVFGLNGWQHCPRVPPGGVIVMLANVGQTDHFIAV